MAFPLISSGVYGCPKDVALKIAMDAIRDFLFENEMTVYLVVYDKKAFQISTKLFENVKTYIDDNYVEDRWSRKLSKLVDSDESPSYEEIHMNHRAFRKAYAESEHTDALETEESTQYSFVGQDSLVHEENIEVHSDGFVQCYKEYKNDSANKQVL